jgi:hypothetical protein
MPEKVNELPPLRIFRIAADCRRIAIRRDLAHTDPPVECGLLVRTGLAGPPFAQLTAIY